MGWERIGVALTLLVFVALYARVLGFSYVWDDVESIAENPIFEGPVRSEEHTSELQSH